MKKNGNQEFSRPGAQFRGKPFWAWNAKLEKNELLRQLRIMKEMGFGGAFMHSRVGLDTAYLSKEWFSLVNACVGECKALDMEAWLYDEDRWPSGAAGGLVTKDPKFRMKELSAKIVDARKAYLPGNDCFAAFALLISNDELTSYSRLKKGEKAPGGSKILEFRARLTINSPWFNGFTYLDTMSKDAVKKFIETTHSTYAKNSGAEFGKTIPGIFTDEPNYGTLDIKGGEFIFPWTEKLPAHFKDCYGYRLEDRLPELVFKVANEPFSKLRHDYFEACTSLFCNNFGKQIYDWCEKNGIQFTGHVLCEESLSAQTAVVGAAMRFYPFMQAPGIDILKAEILKREGGGEAEFLTAKQCASVLNQFGRKWMLSELYGCTGWHFNFAEHKAVGDWQAALGVNLRCPHLSWYSMEGQAKRDYPASIFFQSPWWRDYPAVEDHFARVNLVMSEGLPVRDIAVLHPIESAWGLAYQKKDLRDESKEKLRPIDELDTKLKNLQKTLLEEHYDFDYADEEIMADYGSAAKGRLKIGKAFYKALLVPPSVTIRAKTLRLMEKFRSSGGIVIFIGEIPTYLEAERSELVRKFSEKCLKCGESRDEILAALESLDGQIARVSIKRADGSELNESLYMHRHDPRSGKHCLFVCKTSQDCNDEEVEIRIPVSGFVRELDSETGKIYLADAKSSKNCTVIRTSLDGCGSRLFEIGGTKDASLRLRGRLKQVKAENLAPKSWRIRRSEENAFPLEMPEYSADGGDWMPAEEILRLDRKIRDMLGVPHRGGQMCQPWTRKNAKSSKTIPLALRYSFQADEIPSSPCHLVMERPEKFKVLFNGNELKYDEGDGWWIDTSFKRLKVEPWLLNPGKNEIILETNYGERDNLEAIYFTGDFAYSRRNASAAISMAPDAIPCGDWGGLGFASYTGAMSYETDYEHKMPAGASTVFIRIPSWSGALVKLWVNGRLAGNIAWPPYILEITDFLKTGINRISIELIGTRRNLLGPLHLSQKYPGWTGPAQFVSSGEAWSEEQVLLPSGLLDNPEILFC